MTRRKAEESSPKPKRIRQPFSIGGGKVKVIIEFEEGADVRWSSTQNAVSIAMGEQPMTVAAAPLAAVAQFAPRAVAGSGRVVLPEQATDVNRSGQEFTTNVADEGPGIGGSGITLPPGIDPVAAMMMTPEQIAALNSQARTLTLEKGSDVTREGGEDGPNLILTPAGS